jgi:hypothetical protein
MRVRRTYTKAASGKLTVSDSPGGGTATNISDSYHQNITSAAAGAYTAGTLTVDTSMRWTFSPNTVTAGDLATAPDLLALLLADLSHTPPSPRAF